MGCVCSSARMRPFINKLYHRLREMLDSWSLLPPPCLGPSKQSFGSLTFWFTSSWTMLSNHSWPYGFFTGVGNLQEVVPCWKERENGYCLNTNNYCRGRCYIDLHGVDSKASSSYLGHGELQFLHQFPGHPEARKKWKIAQAFFLLLVLSPFLRNLTNVDNWWNWNHSGGTRDLEFTLDILLLQALRD